MNAGKRVEWPNPSCVPSSKYPEAEVARISAADTYIPLGAAANLVLIQEADIEQAALSLMGTK